LNEFGVEQLNQYCAEAIPQFQSLSQQIRSMEKSYNESNPSSSITTANVQTLTLPSFSYSTSLISSPTTNSNSIDLSPFDITKTIHKRKFSTSKLAKSKSNKKSLTTTSKRSASYSKPENFKDSLFGIAVTPTAVDYLVDELKGNEDLLEALKILPVVSDVSGMTNTQVIDSDQSQVNNQPKNVTSISPATLKGKKVLIRTHFDVTFEPDPTQPSRQRLVESSLDSIKDQLPTIQYLLDSGAQVVVSSHMGFPQIDVLDNVGMSQTFGFEPVAAKLTSLLSKKIKLVTKPFENDGESLKTALSSTDSNDIVLIDNLRFDHEELSGQGQQAEELLSIIQPSLCVYDSFIAAVHDDVSVSQLAILAAEQSIPSVAGLNLSKDLQSSQQFIKSLHGKKVTKTLILGGSNFVDVLPTVSKTFQNTQNYIFGGPASYGLSHTDVVTAQAYDGDSSEEEEMGLVESLHTEVPRAFGGGLSITEIGSSITLLANAGKAKKSIWYPHDHNVKNENNPNATFRRSVQTSTLYDEKALTVTDLGVSTRKDFSFAVDNIISEQKSGQDQVIFWSGSMGDLNESNIYGNGAIIEALDKATNAGVTTIVGGAETLRAIELYTTDSDSKIKNPKFSFITSSPQTVAVIMSNVPLFEKFVQDEKH
jgi:phosphoglycerate kinase